MINLKSKLSKSFAKDGEKAIAIIASLATVGILIGVIVYSEIIVDEDRILEIELGSLQNTILDQSIRFPDYVEVNVKYVELLPNAETEWHKHEVPLIVTVLHGEISVDYCIEGTIDENNVCMGLAKSHKYEEDDIFIEALGVTHKGKNTGLIPVKLHIVSFDEITVNSQPFKYKDES